MTAQPYFALPDLQLSWHATAFVEDADRWFETLRGDIRWRTETYRLFGRQVQAPRRVAWYADAGVHYRYSGCQHLAQPWLPLLEEIRRAVAQFDRTPFNSVLANLYRDGLDSMGWHADDEAQLGNYPVIASISLGARRRLRFRHRADKRLQCHFDLPNGSLLIMRGPTQRYWQHCVPKTSAQIGARINLTFRTILTVPPAANKALSG